MGMADHPVVKVGDALHMRQGHHRALDIDKEIINRAGQHEFGADVGMNLSQFAFDRVP